MKVLDNFYIDGKWVPSQGSSRVDVTASQVPVTQVAPHPGGVPGRRHHAEHVRSPLERLRGAVVVAPRVAGRR